MTTPPVLLASPTTAGSRANPPGVSALVTDKPVTDKSGVGSTVTVNVPWLPSQPASEVGVTVYTTSCGTLVMLVNVWVKVASSVPSVFPVTLALAVTVHVYSEGTPLVVNSASSKMNSTPEHTSAAVAKTGSGLTVTSASKVAPSQSSALIGVTVYVKTTAAPEVFV